MAEDFDVEAMLEAPYQRKDVSSFQIYRKYFYFRSGIII